MSKGLKLMFELELKQLSADAEAYMTQNEVVELLNYKIKRNNEKIYDPTKETAFQSEVYVEYDRDDEISYVEMGYDETKYKAYKTFMQEYPSKLVELNLEKNNLVNKKFVIYKDRKLSQITGKIDHLNSRYKYFLRIQEKERVSDIAKAENQILNDSVQMIKNSYVAKNVNQLFVINPDYVKVDVSKCRIEQDIIDVVKQCQDKAKAIEKQNLVNKKIAEAQAKAKKDKGMGK